MILGVTFIWVGHVLENILCTIIMRHVIDMRSSIPHGLFLAYRPIRIDHWFVCVPSAFLRIDSKSLNLLQIDYVSGQSRMSWSGVKLLKTVIGSLRTLMDHNNNFFNAKF